MKGIHIAVISHKRPENVQPLEKLLNLGKAVPVYWYVNKGEKKVYMEAGAEYVVECGTNICQARNSAVKDAGANFCIQVSDDLKGIKQIRFTTNGSREKITVSFQTVVEDLVFMLKRRHFKYAGVAVTDNALNYAGEDYSFDKLIVNDLICLAPGTYFDESTALKEDYDQCLQQLIYTGGLVRANKYLCNFPHRQNKGGANTYRNSETENVATQKLFAKWGPHIKNHPTRPGQISLNYKQIKETRELLLNANKK